MLAAPKVHFVDSGLAAWLLGIRSAEQLDRHPLRGAVFESWVYGELLKLRFNSGAIVDMAFYRDQHGLEADLIVSTVDHLFVIEVKSGRTVAGDWFAPLQRIAETLRSAKTLSAGREVVPMVIYAGDRTSTQSGTRIVSWGAIEEAIRRR